MGISANIAQDAQALSNLATTQVAFRNRIINGACNVAQRPSMTFNQTMTQGYAGPDRYLAVDGLATGAFTQSQGAITYNGVLRNAVVQTVTTPFTLGTAYYTYGVYQRIEGLNCYDLLGQPVAISFIFETDVSGMYSVTIQDSNATNSYVSTFMAVASVPVKVVIPISVLPLTLNVPNSNMMGLSVLIGALNAGNYTTSTLNTWQAGNWFSATSSTNWGMTIGNYIAVTDLQLEAGTVATLFENRLYTTELGLCQRYYQLAGNGLFGSVEAATVVGVAEKFIVPMRAIPTVSLIPGLPAWIRSGAANWEANPPVLANGAATTYGLWTQVTGFTGLSPYYPVTSRNSAPNEGYLFIGCSAEL
jgi:hypothetical protein